MRARSGWRASSRRASRWRSRAAATVAGLVLAACPADTPFVPPPVVPAGVVRAAVPEEPATLDPLGAGGLSPATRHLLPLLTPLIVHGRAHRSGDVAATFSPAEGATRVEVAPGSRWSDGAPITAADILRTWQLVRAAGVPFSGYERITRVTLTEDGAALVVPPSPATLRLLPPGFSGRAYARAWPVSGGPFVLSGWNRGLRLVFTANPRAPGRTPRLARLDVTVVSDPDAALALFRRGEVDVLTRFGAPAWHARMAAAGATLSETGEGRAVALVLRAPSGAAARRRMLARIDLTRLRTVLVQDEAAFGCDEQPDLGPCASNPPLQPEGPEVSALRLAFASSDGLAGRISVALRRMLGPLRLQPRDDLWTHLTQVDLAIVTAAGRDGLAELEAAGNGPAPRVWVLFVARADLGARIALPAPGPAGPFDGAADWPPAAGTAATVQPSAS